MYHFADYQVLRWKSSGKFQDFFLYFVYSCKVEFDIIALSDQNGGGDHE